MKKTSMAWQLGLASLVWAGCLFPAGDAAGISISTEVLPGGIAGQDYYFVLAAEGGTQPYSWSTPAGGLEETSAASTFAGTGTFQWWKGDDECWDLELPFAFPFFGRTYTSAKINSNGGISFGSSDFADYSYDEGTFMGAPILAVLWTDLNTSDGDIYVERGTDRVKVRWEGAYYGGGEVNFSATLFADGRIVLSYGQGNAAGGFIGASAGDGETVLVSARSDSGSMDGADDVVFSAGAAMPDWLWLGEVEGMLGGWLTDTGTFAFAVTVTDSQGATATKELSLTVARDTGEKETVDGTEWDYKVENGTATVLGASPAEGVLAIPDMLGGVPVAAIGWGAFRRETGLTGVAFPESLGEIRVMAFEGCTGLGEVEFPGGVGNLEYRAFGGCTGLTNAVAPETVTELVDNGAFEDCPNLMRFEVGQSLGTAADAVAEGGTVVARPGTYPRLTYYTRKRVRFLGAGPETTFLDGENWGVCARFNVTDDVVLEGFTLENGYGGASGAVIGGFLKNCVVTNCESSGPVVSQSRMEDCTVTGNTPGTNDAVVSWATLSRCRITGNDTGEFGAAFLCTLDNCLVAENSGRGLHGGTATQCTIAGNGGAGTIYTTLANSIVWGNGETSEYLEDDRASCREGGDATGECIAADPRFADAAAGNYRLADDSPCIDAGAGDWTDDGATDLDGNARVRRFPDMGAWENATAGRWAVRVEIEGNGRVTPGRASLPPGTEATFAAHGDGRPFEGWKLDGGDAGTERVFLWSAPEGSGTVTLTAVFGTMTHYVDAIGGENSNDGTLDAPVASIQEAIDRAEDGETIWVAPGIYGPISTGNKSIRIVSSGGAEATVIDASDTGLRCATLTDRDWGLEEYDTELNASFPVQTNTVLEGFTLRGGYTDGEGGGALGGTLRNCVLTGNTAREWGGGLAYGNAFGCRFEGNLVEKGNWSAGGGGMAYGTAEDCVFTGNRVASDSWAYGGAGHCLLSAVRCEARGNEAPYGGAFSSCRVIRNSVIADNLARDYGGGCYQCYLEDSEITGNRVENPGNSPCGGGLYGGSATNCLIARNRAGSEEGGGSGGGGGASDADLVDCLVEDNVALGHYPSGGGINGGSAVRCTISGNRAESSESSAGDGGGASRATLTECTVSGNAAGAGGGISGGSASRCLIEGNSATQAGGVSDATLENCIVARNRAQEAGGGNTYCDGSHNTFVLNETAVRHQTPGGSDNLFWGETPDGQTAGVMVDPWGGDYRLLAGSPAIDAGRTTGLATDFAGNPRTQGTAPDLGALEAEGGTGVVAGTWQIVVRTQGSGMADLAHANVEPGQGVTVTAPDCGRPFLGWVMDGETVGTERTFTFEPTGHATLTAAFGNGDIWVDATAGNDANSGSEDAPLATLQAAVALACDGDTVRAKPGTYGPFAVEGKRIDIVGEAGAAQTVIDARWQGRCATLGYAYGWEDEPAATLKGFTLRHGSAVREARFRQVGAACIRGWLEDCAIEDCGVLDGYSGDSSVVLLTGLSRCTVRGCAARMLLDAGMIPLEYRNTLVTGNRADILSEGDVFGANVTFAGNEAAQSVLSGGTWRNCIVWDNGTTATQDIDAGWCCIEGAEPRDGDGEQGPVWADNPGFVNMARGDFRLSSDSPLVDAGSNDAAGTGDGTDLAGNPRIGGGTVDLGCFEGGVSTRDYAFELGEGLVQLDDTPLAGRVETGDSVSAPDVAAVSGWRFDGWTPGCENIAEDTVIRGETTAVPGDWTVAIHRGRVETDETWAAGTVHVVEGTVAVAPGATLSIAEGAVVKFAPGASLAGENGGEVVSLGAVFTHLFDDAVGGDTLEDGDARLPAAGEYSVLPDEVGEGTRFRYAATCVATFELGEGLVQLDGTPTSVLLVPGETARPPEVAAVSGWRFDGWTPGCENIVEDTTIRGVTSPAPGDWTVAIHRGRVETDETWAAGTVHVVERAVTVAPGASLTIAEGAVVKFAPGASLASEDGGWVVSAGATFTHLFDDEAGGDTLEDGATRVPVSGDYTVTLDAEGEGTEYRFAGDAIETPPASPATAENPVETVWRPGRVHIIKSTYTVAPHCTLRLAAGTIVKVASGRSLIVEEGGTLIAEGTAAKPVIVTSLRDDTHGGDTNGNGDATTPQAGDWNQIFVRGTARFDHCSVLYCSATANYGGLEAKDGGTIEFDNSEIAHCKYECVNAHGGRFSARNSAFWDASLGFGYFGGKNVQAGNCVFSGLSAAIRQGDKVLVNCVFHDCTVFVDQGGDGSSFSHCVFWNPEDFGEQDFVKVGEDGNVWGDPKFADAAAGDFHILEGSVCLDAGDGTAAPPADMFGNARTTLKGDSATGVSDEDGAIPDIGLHEFGGRYSAGEDVDAVPTEVTLAAGGAEPLQPGDAVTVAWRLANAGSGAFAGTWTDRVKLVDANGDETVLGERPNAGRIEPGTSKPFEETFALPFLMDGEWRIGVEANVDRGVLEGANTENNSLVSEVALTVAVPKAAADGGTLELAAGAAKLVRLTGTLEEGDALWVAATGGTGPVTAWGANGAVPSETRHWTCAATANGGALLAVGGIWNTERTYLLLENGGAEAVTVALSRDAGGGAMRATGLERAEVTAGPMVAVSLEGVGLAGTSALELLRNGAVAASGAGLVATSGKASATFDLQGAEAGEYEVRATDAAGRTAVSPVPLRVLVTPAAKGNLKFKLTLPETVRDGRVYEGTVWYRNIGNADMEAPVFQVYAKEGNVSMSPQATGPFESECILTGRGSGSPAAILRAGEEGTVAFHYLSMGEYTLGVRWMKEGSAARTGDWLEDWAAEEARQAAEAEARAEAEAEWKATAADLAEEFFDAHPLVTPVSAAESGSVGGVLRNAADGEPLAGVEVRLEAVGAVFAEDWTANDGSFSLEDVWPLGEYTLAAEGWRIESGAAVAVTGAVTGVEATARRLTRVTGTLTAGGEGVEGVAVVATADPALRAECPSGKGGAFDLGWLEDGEWTLRTGCAEGYAGASVTLTVAGDGALEVELAMAEGVAWSGRVEDAESGTGVEGVELAICDADGVAMQRATSGAGGAFLFEGAPEGTLRVCSMSPEWMVGDGIAEVVPVPAGDGTATGDVAVAKAPLLAAFPRRGAAPLWVRFDLTEAGERAEAVAWEWDFDGDGITDSTDEAPLWEFANPGTYSASVTLVREDGSSVTGRLDGAVTVRERLPTIYQDGVVVLLEGDPARSTDWEFAGWDADSGTLRVRQAVATPSPAPAAGVKFVFRTEGETSKKYKTATAFAEVSGEEGTWEVATVDVAGLPEIYRQADFTVTTLAADGPSPASRRGGRRGLGGETETYPLEIAGEKVGEVKVTGGADLSANYFVDEDGNEYQDCGIHYDLNLWVEMSMGARRRFELPGIRETFVVPIRTSAGTGKLRLTLDANAGLEGGIVGTWHVNGILSDTITVSDGSASSAPRFTPDTWVKGTIYGGLDAAAALVAALDFETADFGTVTLEGGAGVTVRAGGSFDTMNGGEFSGNVVPRFFTRVVFELGGKQFDIASKAGREKAAFHLFKTGIVNLFGSLPPAKGDINDFFGGPLRSIMEMQAKLVNGIAMSRQFQENLDQFKAALAYQPMETALLLEQMRARAIGSGWEKFQGIPVDAMFDEGIWEDLKGSVHGIESLHGAGESWLLQSLKSHGIGVQLLHPDVYEKALRKGRAACVGPGYPAEKLCLEPVDVDITPGTISQIGLAKLEGWSDSNPLRSAEALFGEYGSSQTVWRGETGLDHVFGSAGYYVTRIQAEHEFLSAPPQFMMIQVMDLDVADEDFPTAHKGLMSVMGEALGIPDVGLASPNAWQPHNGDRMPSALKTMFGLNPILLDTTGDGIVDEWSLRVELEPLLWNANKDYDGDGVTTYQEYKRTKDGEMPEPQSRRAASRDSEEDPWEGDGWTHPCRKDTDRGGASDGMEVLWGTDPNYAPDDPQTCKGCEGLGGSPGHCVCTSVHHVEVCECGGCPECMPEKDKKKKPVQSCDPNEIAGPPGSGEARLVEAGSWMDYTIYFENKEDAGASAQEIRVEMQLDPRLDWESFEAGNVVVGSTWDPGLTGKANWTSEVAMADGDFLVRSTVSADAETGRVEWYLRAVDPDAAPLHWPRNPYKGILDPNDPDTHCGEGRLDFRVRLRDDAPDGAIVAATATIVFDYNDPIQTDPSWWNTVAETMFEVTFVNDNGRELKEAAPYASGTPAADIVQPEEPAKAATAQYTYTFAGWVPPLADVTEDATYMATYSFTTNHYDVTFTWNGGSSVASYAYGTAAADVAVPDNPPDYFEGDILHRFVGWEPAVAEVTGDAVYEAQYSESGAIAQVVGGEVYPSLAAAVAAAPAGATVVLLADDEVSFAEGGVVIDKDLVIDGGGFTVRGVSNANIHNVTAGATPPDEEFDGVDGANVRGFFVKGGNVTFTNLVLTEFGDTDYVNKFGYTPIQTANAYDGALAIADVSIDKFNRTAICIRGGTFSISGVTIEANAANRDVLEAGKDYAQQPIEIRGGTGTIEGVSITGGDAYPGKPNGYGAIVAWSDVTVRDVSIDFTGVGIWADYANITVTGDDTSVAATGKALFVEDGGSITVETGDFAGVLAVDAVQGNAIVVNGGTFDAPVPAAFAGEGLLPTTIPDANGKYTVATARTVTFDSNGGTPVVAVAVPDGEPVAEPDPSPEKEHFTLRAWQLNGADYDFDTPVTADIELVADWTPTLQTVTFDPGLYGTCATASMTFPMGGTYHDLPTTKSDGFHARLGWFTAPDGEGGDPVADGDLVEGPTNLTLYAHWTTEQTLTFDAQNGTAPQRVLYTVGERYGSLPKPTWENHAFLGWFSEPEGGKKFSATSIVTTRPTRTMYAHWTTTQTVIFDAQGGECDPATMVAEMGGRYGPLPTPVKDGWTFEGWFTKADGGNHLAASSIVTTLKTRTFYAHWTHEQTVVFDAQGGTVDPATMVAKMGGRYGALPKPTKAGYAFLGWYSKADGGTHLTASSIVTTLKTRTFYAHWTAEQVVTFDPQGGTCDTPEMVATVGQAYGALPKPTLDGYTFRGWYTKADGGSKVTASSTVTAAKSRKLFAHWREKSGVTITGFSAAPTSRRSAERLFTIRCDAVAGTDYEIQWTPSLDAEWTVLKRWTAPENGETSVTVPLPSPAPTGFFRLATPDGE